MIVMREPVPNRVAEEFFKNFLLAFAAERLPLFLSVQQARRKLQGLEDDFPGASWLPVICMNPAVEPPTWLKLGGIPPCPYRGLFAFREEDAQLFFGREQFTINLVMAVKKKPLVAVIGSSGSGKSSVVFAGLIPQLRQDTLVEWQIVWFRPLNNPIAALAAALAPLYSRRETNPTDTHESHTHQMAERDLTMALQQDESALYKTIEDLIQQNVGTRLLLIVDQFEELYTLCPESERQPFLNGLLKAVRLAPAFTLVMTLRADFYGYALSDRTLSDALQGAILNLGPMNREELRQAIERPAMRMEVKLEKELTDELIYTVKDQPGHLPLLEFALTQLWVKQQDGLLTHQAYEEIGGVEKALANHAEAVYAQLNETDRNRAQQVFMQLVRLGEGGEATRRLATRSEVKEDNWDLVISLASSRLVVTNRNESTHEETVEIVHEALIKNWGRLESWMQIDGEFRRAQEQLRSAIRQWESSGKDEGALLRGKLLADAEYWQNQRFLNLSEAERNFIKLSLELREQEINKQKRRQRHTISLLTGGLVLALGLAGAALWQWRKVRLSEIQAISASSEALFASNQRFNALIAALRAAQKLQMIGVIPKETQSQVESVLRQAVYGVFEYNTLSGHSEQVNAVAFSPDGKLIASASDDQTVKIWKQDGTLLNTLKSHSDKVCGVAFSPNGQIIATASADNTVKLWKPDGTLLNTLKGHSDKVYDVAFSPDAQMIATASADKTVKLWKPDGTLLNTLKGHNNEVKSVAFSPDNQTIATASADNTVKLWKPDGTLLNTLKGHNDKVYGVAFSPNGQMIASASLDKTIKVWNREGQLLTTINNNYSRVYKVAFSPDSQTIASVSRDKTLRLWTKNGLLLRTLNGHNDIVWGVAFSPDGQMIATASSDKTVKLWKLQKSLLTILYGHSEKVWGVAFSPDGQMIATASDDKTVKLWSRSGTEQATLKGHSEGVWGVAFSPDDQMIATASRDKTVKLWTKNGVLLHTLKDHQAGVNAVAFSPDGQIIATASDDKTVKLWTRNGVLLHTLYGHLDQVWGVTFSPDGKIVASSSRDKTVKLWSLDGQQMTTLKGHLAGVRSVAFSGDGQIIATASWDKTVKLWNRNGRLLHTLKGHQGPVFAAVFSPDGQTIASASDDKTVKLWNRNGVLLHTLNGHSDIVSSVAFSPDGKTIASASDDKTVILWNLDRAVALDKVLTYGCGWVSDYLRTNVEHPLPEVSHFCRKIKPQPR